MHTLEKALGQVGVENGGVLDADVDDVALPLGGLRGGIHGVERGCGGWAVDAVGGNKEMMMQTFAPRILPQSVRERKKNEIHSIKIVEQIIFWQRENEDEDEDA